MLLEHMNMPAEGEKGVQGQRTGPGQQGNELPAEWGPASPLQHWQLTRASETHMTMIFKEELFVGVLGHHRKCQRP